MINVRVPATSANIGPGFDAFGLAYQLYNTFSFREKDDGKLTIRGVSHHYQGKSNLVYKAMNRVFERVNYSPKGLYIYSDINVPVSRGLGSSATCIVAGLAGANALCGHPLTEKTIFNMAVEMEGHPDNIAPAMYGGLVCSIGNNDDNYYIKKEVADCFAFHLIIPNFPLSTKAARKALPKTIPHKDGVFNVSRATMTYLALTEGRPDILSLSMKDRLHQPYRRSLIRSYDIVCKKAEKFGALGECISGAGPTILVITNQEESKNFTTRMSSFLHATEPEWRLLTLKPDHVGYTTEETEA